MNVTDKLSIINQLIVRLTDTPMPRLHDWEEKQIVLEALRLLAEGERMTRESILRDAEICVCGKRQEDYGSPEDNFKAIATLWSSYGETDFDAHDVAIMMALLKIGRIMSGRRTKDSYVDACGYLACAGELSGVMD